MHYSRTHTLIGKYAIYFNSLSEAIKEHSRAFLGMQHRAPFNLTDTMPKDEKGTQEDAVTKLEGVVEKSQNVLIKSSAVFPFDFFPDSITIDRQKLTVVHRNFFNVKQTVCVQHSDIKNIQADIGPFFGSLTVTSEHFINNIQTIKFLPKKEVLSIQQLIQGFIIAHNEGVDMADINDEKLVSLLNQLGRGEAGERVIVPKQ